MRARSYFRGGSIRSDLLGYAVVFLAFVVLIVMLYRTFTQPEPPATPATPVAAGSTSPQKPAGRVPFPADAIQRQPVMPTDPPPRVYTRSLAEDRIGLTGAWILPPQTEVKGGPRPGLRLMLDAASSQLTCARLNPADPPPLRRAYRYEVIEADEVRYLKLTPLDVPNNETFYLSYYLEGGQLELDGERTGRMLQGKLHLDQAGATDLQGVFER